MQMNSMNVLVTGGAGFIGSHLVDRLIGEGCRVTVLDNLANGREENLARHAGNPRFTFIRGDINDGSALSRAVHGAQTVFHMACLGVRHSIRHPVESHEVNAGGTLRVLLAAQKAGIRRFVYCSSSEVYGTAQSVPMPESHPTMPCTVYGAGKLAGEAYARAFHLTYGMEVVIVRPFNTYGPRSHHEGDAGEMIPKSIVRALANEPALIFGDGSQTRDFTYVEDMARGICEAGRSDGAVGGTFNIGSNAEVTILRIAEMIWDAVGSRPKISYLDARPGDVLRLYADPSLFRKLTGWAPSVTLDDGIKKTVEYFKSRPEGVSVLLGQEKGRNWE